MRFSEEDTRRLQRLAFEMSAADGTSVSQNEVLRRLLKKACPNADDAASSRAKKRK